MVCKMLFQKYLHEFMKVIRSKLENGKPVINGENGVFDSTRPFRKSIKGKSFKPVDLKDIYDTNWKKYKRVF